jgi:hypothetical protein
MPLSPPQFSCPIPPAFLTMYCLPPIALYQFLFILLVPKVLLHFLMPIYWLLTIATTTISFLSFIFPNTLFERPEFNYWPSLSLALILNLLFLFILQFLPSFYPCHS